jgi:hypothetical protein
MSNLGRVCIVPYKPNELSTGTKGILCNNEVIGIVEIDHQTFSGHYCVTGDNYKDVMEEDMYLAGLYIKTEDKKLHLLIESDWNIAINKINQDVKYKLLDPAFEDGGYYKLCVKCGAAFGGSKTQQLCMTCSSNIRFAKLQRKRPRIKSLNV